MKCLRAFETREAKRRRSYDLSTDHPAFAAVTFATHYLRTQVKTEVRIYNKPLICLTSQLSQKFDSRHDFHNSGNV